MRILFMGTPDFAVRTLEKLIDSRHEVIGAVTQPDKQKGRSKELAMPPVKELALQHQVPVYQPMKARDPEFIQMVRELAPDAIVVAAFGQILTKELLVIPPYGCINVHGSLLPKYRGAAPIQYSIIDGEQETGITIMHMDVGIDTGDIILQRPITIDADETGGSLFDKMAGLGADLLIEALEQIEAGVAPRISQNDEGANYVKVIDKSMGNIDFTKPAVVIERLIRGLNPWPSAFTKLNDKTLKIWSASVENTDLSGIPGEIIEIRKDSFVIKTGEGALVVKEVQLEGKKRMDCNSFLRGYMLEIGTKLG